MKLHQVKFEIYDSTNEHVAKVECFDSESATIEIVVSSGLPVMAVSFGRDSEGA